uniref:Uncharacterized protein AlNc14C225G9201 n=1 Tax=Albugo laibachii Nc14 TaxID=890382 RepID=F0WS63_9STRA|nr:conserved hypothetical protein [Albugo laibachii Nc14]CCA26548.1 conserved hypothetical protein [Albugo laibachii Nc14]|eukprot:CCA26548.1 conserved hypothetical protein [Albugo laibachii Nc14]
MISILASGKGIKKFCHDWNQLLMPCVDSYLIDFLEIIEKDPEHCSQISDYLDMLKWIVPPTAYGRKVDIARFLLDGVFNNINRLLCTSRSDNSKEKGTSEVKCAAVILEEITTRYQEDSFSIAKTLIFPLFTIQSDSVCKAMEGADYTDSVSLEISKFLNLGCCSYAIRPFMTQLVKSFEYISGSSAVDTLNGMVEWGSNGSQTSGMRAFVGVLSHIENCPFSTKCKDPKHLAHLPTEESASGKMLYLETNNLSGTTCKLVSECNDAETMCTQVCASGSLQINDWLRRTLAYQRALTYKAPLCEAQLPGTHNSAITLSDGYGLRDKAMNAYAFNTPQKPWSYIKTNNQALSLTDQLDSGVRFLEVDTHFFLNDFYSAHCGGGTNNIMNQFTFLKDFADQLSHYGPVFWDQNLVGCYPSLSGISASKQVKTRTHIAEIRDWIEKNKDEFLMLYLDNGVEITNFQKWNGLHEILLENDFNKVFVPLSKLKQMASSGWSKTSINDLMAEGYRVLLLSNTETELFYEINNFCGKLLDLPADCPDKKIGNGEVSTPQDPVASSTKFTRMYQEELRLFSINGNLKFSHGNPRFLTAETIPQSFKCNVNVIAPDMLDISKMEAMIWSWNVDEPRNVGPDTSVYMTESARWITGEKSLSDWKACFNKENMIWRIVKDLDDCPMQFVYEAPQNGNQNFLLQLGMKYFKPQPLQFVKINADVSFFARFTNVTSSQAF